LHLPFECLGVFGRNFAKETTVRFAEECRQRMDELLLAQSIDFQFDSQATGERHFGDGHRQAAFAEVVATSQKSLVDRLMELLVEPQSQRGIDVRNLATLSLVDQRVVGTTEFLSGGSHHVDSIPRSLQVHRHAAIVRWR
jgi:hypothetical protein